MRVSPSDARCYAVDRHADDPQDREEHRHGDEEADELQQELAPERKFAVASTRGRDDWPGTVPGTAPICVVMAEPSSGASRRGRRGGQASNWDVALTSRLVTRVIASRMKNWKMAKAAATP